ncbi:Methionine aminopeptidase 2 [Micropruina glycogenica]|jgi:methionyl aminopeptidase|uniref:Methionine aminopeptidase n=1 Tax=Micropruina glycogenica TaxID=75385 RepID=A0A2N9JID0_9ACTN|nr:Methionine aminopeptidase 2 [Micropruina glycogenica]
MIAPVTAIKPYPLTARRQVPRSITRPHYVGRPAPDPYRGSHVQSPEVIEKMRVAGRIAAQAMHVAAEAIAPGITTDELDAVAHAFICDQGAYPSALGYRGFPKSICTSVNEVICHGIPDSRPLEDGDLVKIDVTVFIDGVHGDNCGTFFCGEVDQASADLTERTQEALNRAIKAVRPGRQVNVIGRVIESYAKRFGYGVVRDYTGHGVHTAFHSGLVIPHYDEPSLTTVIEPGMTFTIEPMLTLGDQANHLWRDGWTVVTNDGSRCAQFEHSLVVTPQGAEILTLP